MGCPTGREGDFERPRRCIGLVVLRDKNEGLRVKREDGYSRSVALGVVFLLWGNGAIETTRLRVSLGVRNPVNAASEDRRACALLLGRK